MMSLFRHPSKKRTFWGDRTSDRPSKRHEQPVGLFNYRSFSQLAQYAASGNLNISSRQLSAIPNLLFSIHLGVDPKPLSSCPAEQSQPPEDRSTTSSVAWYEAQDLTTLKARDNDIEMLQVRHLPIKYLSTSYLDSYRKRLACLGASKRSMFVDRSFPLSLTEIRSLVAQKQTC